MVSHAMCHLSPVMCYLWPVMCHLSPDDLEGKDHSMNQSVYDEAVYRTAPATLSLFKIFAKNSFWEFLSGQLKAEHLQIEVFIPIQ